MKLKLLGVASALMLLLGGCSLLDEANDILSYVNGVSNYVDKATTFAQEAPQKVQQALQDEQAVEDLKTELENMKREIQAFDKLEAPGIASDLHTQIEEKNAQLLDKINLYLQNIENGTLGEEVLKNEDLAQPIQDIMSIYEQIKELGR
ncbi:hypothetical protein DRW41_08660 [Neobacillus piezotolerans]|uniref:Lipoprotein n=1 Tax=Neobacillus piezotolerans TaxID=2259171 RepID=A0A3D8GV13_9BACI|nr:DUF6376 family protein [Neobacillus piezotolerans]RDU37876.1 hypothetical protein DRW41_08660 [Neobacillus piezotolerans]